MAFSFPKPRGLEPRIFFHSFRVRYWDAHTFAGRASISYSGSFISAYKKTGL